MEEQHQDIELKVNYAPGEDNQRDERKESADKMEGGDRAADYRIGTEEALNSGRDDNSG